MGVADRVRTRELKCGVVGVLVSLDPVTYYGLWCLVRTPFQSVPVSSWIPKWSTGDVPTSERSSKVQRGIV